MTEPLVLNTVIGYGGQVENGLIAHPDGRLLIYPLGSTIVLRDRDSSESQEFLQGHSDKARTETACCYQSGSISSDGNCCMHVPEVTEGHQ